MANVKEIVDEIYDLTGMSSYHGSFASKKSRYRHIVSILLKRGSLIRSGHKNEPIYEWNKVAMAPTKQFYRSVAEQLVTEERESTARWDKKKRMEKDQEKKGEPLPIVGIDVSDGMPVINPVERLDDVIQNIPDQQLWDELKRRGFGIEDGRLVKKIYFD